MRSTRALSLALFLVAIAAHGMRGQTGVFSGVVTGDTLGHPVPRAEVALPELNRTTLANESGEFRFNDVPAGHYAVVVRAIGFQLMTTSIDLAAARTLDAELTLLPTVARLDSVRTTAPAAPPILPKYEEFESRQKAHISGYFLSDSLLRRRDRDNLAQLIAMLPSVREHDGILLSSHGGNSAGPVFGGSGLGGIGACAFTVYVDGAKFFQLGDGTGPPDFSKMHVEDFYGVEVYPSLANAPAQYISTGPNCGVILLWTRPLNHP